jgi:hypothetical protein
MSEKAYQVVKKAKLAVLQGKERPQECPEDVWLVLKEMYEKNR